MTYWPLWKNVTNYLQGIKSRKNLHSSSFLLLHLWTLLHKILSHSFEPNHLGGMPHDRQEAKTGGSDWLKRPPNYHTTSLRGGKMRWPRILVFQTTRVFALEIHGIREKHDHGPQSLSNLIKKYRRMSTCNRLDLQTLGYQPIMPKNLPDHWSPLAGHQKQKSLKRCCSSQWHVTRVVTPYIIRWHGWYYPTVFHSLHHQITCQPFGICLIFTGHAISMLVVQDD